MSNPIDHQTQAPSTITTRKSKRSVSAGQILAAILFVLVVVFFAENTDDVRIRLIAGPKITAPIWVALVIAAVVGALIAGLLRFRRKRHQNG